MSSSYMFPQESIKNFQWFQEPASWKVSPEGLFIEPDSGSDFWQRTHYGFRNDNAHFLYKEVEGDFEMTTTVSFSPQHRYDQAGLCVRIDEDNWLKTSTEYETREYSHLGAVVTNLGYSDWSTQEIPANIRRVEYKIIRKGKDFEVYAKFGQKDFQQIRIAHLHKDAPKIQAGLYACSPTDKGFSALFETFEIKQQN
jgi:regulation of enolase protein 1 (concanavalin A-like superfamily)